MRGHALKYREIFLAIPQGFPSSLREDTSASHILVDDPLRIYSRVIEKLEHSRQRYSGVGLEVGQYTRNHA